MVVLPKAQQHLRMHVILIDTSWLLLRDAMQRARIAMIVLAAFVDDDNDDNINHDEHCDDDDGATITTHTSTETTTADGNATNRHRDRHHHANYKQTAWILRKCFRTVWQQLQPSLLHSDKAKEEIVATATPASTVLSSKMNSDAPIGTKISHQQQYHESDVVSVLPSHTIMESLSSSSSSSLPIEIYDQKYDNTSEIA
jgi:hypothetical protein